MVDLKETVQGMTSGDYRERFRAEYHQLHTRYLKLKDFCNKIEIAEVHGIGNAPKHDCPLTLLRDQQKWMGLYLSCLEKRAIVEGIDL